MDQQTVSVGRRKAPRQKRSRILVEQILANAGALFEREGYANVSTNRIAEAAHISVGSIYQYFSNREAIAFALYEAASMRLAAAIRRHGIGFFDAPLDEAIRGCVSVVIDLLEKDRYILLKLPTEAPELRAATYSATFDLLSQQLTTTYLSHHFPKADRAVLSIKSYIMQQCFVGLITGYFDEQPAYLPRHTLIEEVTRLIQVYLATAGEA
jgi:AcrR family transcriptional regulator